MQKEDLLKYKKELEQLSAEEKKQRKLYLRGLATGEIQGPPVGYSEIDKQWLKHYDKEEILNYTVPKKSIYSYMCEERLKNSSLDSIVMEYEGIKITTRKMFKHIEKLAKALKNYGINPGDCVSVCLPNFPEVTYAFYALNKIGAVVNFIDPRAAEEDIKNAIVDTDSKLLITMDVSVSETPNDLVINKIKNICDETKLNDIVVVNPLASMPKLIQQIVKRKKKELDVKIPKDKRFISWDDFISKNFSKNPKVNTDPPYYKENATAIIAYTGGTTGKPKGSRQTNESLLSVIEMNKYNHYNATPGDRALNIAPPWTYYGVNNALNAFICMGLDVLMVPKATAGSLGKLISKYKPNHIITVPSELDSVVECEDLAIERLTFLKSVIVGAAKLAKETEERFNNFLAEHDCPIKVTKGYGATEVTASVAYTKEETNIPTTVGVPFIGNDIAIFDKEDPDRELMTGESGEIAVRGDSLMQGYLGREDETKEILKTHADGTIWAHLQDKGRIDEDGLLYCEGRYKRMFMRNGFKVFPDAIEEKIMEYDGVDSCCVVDVADPTYGSIAKAYIVLDEDKRKDFEEKEQKIKEYLQSKLYDYEVPDLIEFIDELPLTPMLKVDYMALEKDAQEKYNSEGGKVK